MTIANDTEDLLLDAVFNAVDYPGQSTVYVKLHTGDPGEACTANAAGETTREAATFGASSGGVVTSDADITWTSVSTTETYTHISLWTMSTGGTALWYGELSPHTPVTIGGNFTIASGDLTVSLD